MKILQKTIAATATSAILLGSLAIPFTVLAAATKATAEPTPTESPVPTIAPTVAPVETTPAPQSTSKWIMTHKKISLGILLVVAAGGYGLNYLSKKNKQSPPEGQPKSEEEPRAEEEPKKEDQTPPENSV